MKVEQFWFMYNFVVLNMEADIKFDVSIIFRQL